MRQARFQAGNPPRHDGVQIHDDKENRMASENAEKAVKTAVKRDFFGRVVEAQPLQELDCNGGERTKSKVGKGTNVWVTFHEGLNNAVRKPISLQEFLRGL
jgi:chromosome transmission fidelity protein 18